MTMVQRAFARMKGSLPLVFVAGVVAGRLGWDVAGAIVQWIVNILW